MATPVNLDEMAENKQNMELGPVCRSLHLIPSDLHIINALRIRFVYTSDDT